MGYYTYYTGSLVENGDPEVDRAVAKAIANLPSFHCQKAYESVEDFFDMYCSGSMKWYDWKTDMQEVSKQFPDVTIYLHGDGEDREDMWDAYFKDGKVAIYKAKITYPPFNPKDLRE